MSNETAYAQSAAPGQPDSASGASRVARAASVSDQLPPEPPTPCFRCVQEIYLSFFFDGFGQSLDDLDHLSNIGRLYNAHAKSSDELGIYATYYEGMGRDLSTQTTGTLKKVATDTASALSKEAQDKFIKDPGKKIVTEAGKNALASRGEQTIVAHGTSVIHNAISYTTRSRHPTTCRSATAYSCNCAKSRRKAGSHARPTPRRTT